MEQPQSYGQILIIDEDAAFAGALQARFVGAGRGCITATRGEVGLELEAVADLVILSASSLSVLDELRSQDPEVPVILLAEPRELAGEIRVFDHPRLHYLPRQVEFEVIEERVSEILTDRTTERELRFLRHQCLGGTCAECAPSVGSTPSWRRVLRQVDQAAQGEAPVLVIGEPGVGKSICGRLIHRLSSRSEERFLEVDAGAIPAGREEDYLFLADDGLVAAAGAGTLMLEQVASLSREGQDLLARALADGGSRIECRILASNTEGLRRLVEEGRFLEQLYYRLAVSEITVPPLRQRRDDIPALVVHFLRCQARSLGQPLRRLAPEAVTALSSADWPGNVRQLENVIRQTLSSTGDRLILPEDLPPGLTGERATEKLKQATRGFERNYISLVLKETLGDKPLTAKRLGISLASLYEKIKRYEL